MSNKVKLRSITCEGFRGARKEIPLEFGTDNKSLVLFGNNGDGKSSFTDAIEWFFTDKIDFLQREGCGRVDYFNRYMPPKQDAKVQIHFSDKTLDAQKTLKRKGGYSFSNTDPSFQDYIATSLKDSVILRHHTMREFIDKTKKDKLERVEEIIGFGIVKEGRDALLKATNSLKDDRQLNNLLGQLKERKRELVDTVAKELFTKHDIFTTANTIATQCDPALVISDDPSFKSVCDTLEKKAKADTQGKELLKLDSVNETASKLLKITEVPPKMNGLLTYHNDLAKRRDTIKASAIEKLYKAAIEAMEKKWVKPGECPLCKKPTDTEVLLKSLMKEVEQTTKVLEERRKTVENARAAKAIVSKHQTVLTALLEDEQREMFLTPEASQKLDDVRALFSDYDEVLNKIQVSPEALLQPVVPNAVGDLEETANSISVKVAEKKKDLSKTDEEKKYYQNIYKLRKLYDDHLRYEELNKHIDIYSDQISSLERISQDFENMERSSVQKVLKALSSDVNDFMRSLHPDDDFDEVELALTAGRGIEFKLKYHGAQVSPPMRILSEAHLNSLGICLFLASAKHFNKTNEFLILDDVVTSFDMDHRRPLARLMSETFPETQFLLFTHDELWFEMLKKELPMGNWLFKELMKWTKDEGLILRDAPLTLRETVKDSLSRNDISSAANKCRTLIEEIFKEKCEDLGVKGLEFRRGTENDQRDASELINALTSYVKVNQTLRGKQSKISFDHIRASQLIANIGSHHRTLTTTKLSRGDIQLMLRDIDHFESLFVCPKCKKEAHKKYSPRSAKLKQCQCGELKV